MNVLQDLLFFALILHYSISDDSLERFKKLPRQKRSTPCCRWWVGWAGVVCVELCPPPPPPPPPPPATPPPTLPPEPEDDTEEVDPDMTVTKFLEILQELEAAYPDVPPDEMLHKLRMLVSDYDTTIWKMMFNVNNLVSGPGQIVDPFPQNVTGLELQMNLLTRMMNHTIHDGIESGVLRIGQDTVALAPVIIGMAAGYDHHTVLGMHDLFAATTSDHSAVDSTYPAALLSEEPAGTWQDFQYVLPGPVGLATHPEILGDIDGFNLGKRVAESPDLPLSEQMSLYYSSDDYHRRLEILEEHTTKPELTYKVYSFCSKYHTCFKPFCRVQLFVELN